MTEYEPVPLDKEWIYEQRKKLCNELQADNDALNARIKKLEEDKRLLRDALDNALPFIGYSAHVPNIENRAYEVLKQTEE